MDTKILPQVLPHIPRTEIISFVQLLKIPSAYHLCGMKDLLALRSSGSITLVSSSEEKGTQKNPQTTKKPNGQKKKKPTQTTKHKDHKDKNVLTFSILKF